jgi:hypothetical protein
MKASGNFHNGPYAVLVRDVAFDPSVCRNNDYLRVPEIVRDICGYFKEVNGVDLQSRFIENSQSCIVKFKVTSTKLHELRTALSYLYSSISKEGVGFAQNCNFDAGGKAIPPSAIEQIEVIEWKEGRKKEPTGVHPDMSACMRELSLIAAKVWNGEEGQEASQGQ